jgi:ADP-heptose:LPS heptosyltransferase
VTARGNRLHKRLDAWAGGAAIAALAPFSRAGRDAPVPAPARILVVKLAALGDTILLVPALRALRRRFPAARIEMLGTGVNRAMAGELDAWIDAFHCLEPGRALRDPRYLAAFVGALRRGGFDAAVDFDQWTKVTPLLLRLAAIPVRVGFRTRIRGRHRLYTHVRPRDPAAHESENFLALLAPLGVRGDADRRLELPVRADAVARVRALLSDAGWDGAAPLVVVHPGCGHAHPRAWPAERYRETLAAVAAGRDAFFAVTGAGGEADAAERVAGGAPGRAAALTTLSVAELVACVSLAALTLSGNTGTMHVAAALGRPQVVLEGPNDPAKWGPLNELALILRSDCPGCPCLDLGWEFHATDGSCMARIPTAAVVAAVTEMLDRASAEGRPRATTHAAAAPFA